MAKFNLKAGTDYLPSYNLEPGMNDELAYSDRAGWTTSTEMLCGGVSMGWGELGGLEVGPQYDLDVMGEERSMTTFSSSEPKAKGMIGEMATAGAPGMQSTQRTLGGKSVDLSEPQTYNSVGLSKK